MKFIILFLVFFYNFSITSGVCSVYVPPDVAQYVGQENFDEYFIPVFMDNTYDVGEVKIEEQSLLRYVVEYFPEMIPYLVKYGADVQEIDDEKNTLLIISSRFGDAKAAKQLLQYNVDVNLVNNRGATALHYACQFGCKKEIELLLQHGADINRPNGYTGSTPLIVACYYNKLEIIKILLNYGAGDTINIKNSKQRTALSYARQKCSQEIVDLLKQHGAK